MFLKIFMLCSCILLINCEVSSEEAEDYAVIQINFGNVSSNIMGTQNTTWKGETYYSFRGIPYVQAPIGALRFKDPQPLVELPNFIDARYDGHDCPSIYANNASEDCLILNVYTKQLSPRTPLPVIVFIHQGGWYVGSGLSRSLSPEYLLSKDIVLVTFNYRLGTLGFLSLDSEEVPGNAGFKDQVLAMRWLQKYVPYFGGNAADITLMGYSAGATSVGLHLVSPMSQGIFNKAIIMSGALPPQAILPVGDQCELVVKQAKLLNCPKKALDSATEILACLQQRNATEIANTLPSLFDFGKENTYLWLPVLETDFGQERFLTADYYDSLKTGKFHKVPILIGFLNGDFCSCAAAVIEDELLEKRFYEDFEQIAPKIFTYKGQNHEAEISNALKEHYLKNSTEKNTDFVRLCDLFSDALIRFGAKRISEYASKYVDVYNYKFAYRGKYSNSKYETDQPRAEHVDDLMYLFSMRPHRFEAQEKEAQIVEMYTNFIYDFALNGKPTSPGDSKYPNHTLITTILELVEGLNFEDAAFWDQLFP